MKAKVTQRSSSSFEFAQLRPVQVAWLAAAVFSVSAGFGALMPVLPAWLTTLMPGATAGDVARHVGFLSAAYAMGVLLGAPLWGVVGDRVGRGRILILGLVGYVVSSLLLLFPALTAMWGMYALRFATGFFVAAVIPVVAALVAEYTPEAQRARRFAWLGAMSLLGFLFGPALTVLAEWIASGTGEIANAAVVSAEGVVVLSSALGAVMILGVAATMPTLTRADLTTHVNAASLSQPSRSPLWLISGTVAFVLAAFELGIVLQGREHADVSPRQIAMMFAECSLVMLGVNAVLFLTGLLEKISARTLMGAGLILAMAGLAVLALHRTDLWMYVGIGFTSAGTGLVLPVIAYLAAGASQHSLGATMGGLAAAGGLGQTLGSFMGGWLFGAVAQRSFAWLALPFAALLAMLILRPGSWSAISTQATHSRAANRRVDDQNGAKVPGNDGKPGTSRQGTDHQH